MVLKRAGGNLIYIGSLFFLFSFFLPQLDLRDARKRRPSVAVAFRAASGGPKAAAATAMLAISHGGGGQSPLLFTD